MNLNENRKIFEQRVLLVGVDFNNETNIEASLAELALLTKTAGGKVIKKIIQKRKSSHPKTFLGAGKLVEIKKIVEDEEIDLVIFDNELSASQTANISEILEVGVIDRTVLILDIFASRAKTAAGKLQVEAAQFRYLYPRLKGRVQNLSKLGGGIGTRGPGETMLETNRRYVKGRLLSIENKLKELEKQRKNLRESRKRNEIPIISLTGYTNAGKSSLFNSITNASVFAEDMLFCTLDPTVRKLDIKNNSCLLVDTVGFINGIPHTLIDAFKSTLDEILNSDLVLNICDASDIDYIKKNDIVKSILTEIGYNGKIIDVYNKSDLLSAEERMKFSNELLVSVKQKDNFDTLFKAIYDELFVNNFSLKLEIPYTKMNVYSELKENYKINTEERTADGITLSVDIPENSIFKFKEFITK